MIAKEEEEEEGGGGEWPYVYIHWIAQEIRGEVGGGVSVCKSLFLMIKAVLCFGHYSERTEISCTRILSHIRSPQKGGACELKKKKKKNNGKP